MGIKVSPKSNESIGSVLKRLRKLCEKEGLMRDIRRQEAYEKPSEKRRRAAHRSKSRTRQANQEATNHF
ncbi:hypothetical protein LCGC14_1329900 [marine sediment metagenome]|uniref:30S ribosomal protein S21 n=1 Tax=marine sediment metagenome TaxID=412755 RepID=A0A0F9L2V2_9ZZZZ